jgi:hypothetical protein
VRHPAGLRTPARGSVLKAGARVVHDEIVLSVPADVAADVERVVVDALSFPWAPTGADQPVQVEAGLGKRRGCTWGDVYRT